MFLEKRGEKGFHDSSKDPYFVNDMYEREKTFVHMFTWQQKTKMKRIFFNGLVVSGKQLKCIQIQISHRTKCV